MSSSATRHSRYQLEATMTPAQVLRYIVDREGPQTRRFRVEGTRAGNSRLLAHDVAISEQLRYGGTLVELVTMDQVYAERAKSLPACKREGCKALAGAACRNARGALTNPHANRLGEHEAPVKRSASAGLASCPQCAAHAGAACVTPQGKKRKPHKGRPAMGGTP